MPSAIISAINKDGKFIDGRALLDTCSTANFITESFARSRFHIPKGVDLLLGSVASLSVFSIGQIPISHGHHDIILQKTRLGWVVAGGAPNSETSRHATCKLSQLKNQIERFWEVEEVQTNNNKKSKEEIACEEFFVKTIDRTTSGRYVVRLPFKENNGGVNRGLGNSYRAASRRFLYLEKKFINNPQLRLDYTKVINEYLDLGHMTLVEGFFDDGYFLPHHPVFKETSMTTKLRVVFDASAKTDNGKSLNDMLMVGPTIQNKLFEQLIKFRTHKFVITADIEKMYRQVKIHEDDQKYQRIIWRDNDGHLKVYELNTVTFGVASSPYLAIRTLHQLADDERDNYPLAATCLKTDLYVDDLLSGSDTIENTIELRDQLINILKSGGFNIRQWASNDERIINGLTDKNVNSRLLLDKACTLKTLGISWQIKDDNITYNVNSIKTDKKLTKRHILSEIAKIFDPLGLLGPIILHAKVIMQKIWKEKLHWDESVPPEIHRLWLKFVEQLSIIETLTISRRLIIEEAIDIQLHGFCDASLTGYGACLYMRSTNNSGKIICRLICAKSKVAPLKPTITIPRLELCGALLLTRLFQETSPSIPLRFNKIIFWGDSEIVLHWLKTEPHKLQTYVSNRVNEIQERTKEVEWRYVPSKSNPADILSRGTIPHEFVQNKQWFEGPDWLNSAMTKWPDGKIKEVEVIELKKKTCLINQIESHIFLRFSSYAKLKRVIAYCLRFKLDNKHKGFLNPEELHTSEMTIIKILQASTFKQEIECLRDDNNVKQKNRLKNLSPFIDADGILRVGGRLKGSDLVFDQKHPILIPAKNPITDLIIRELHINNHHAGIQSTLYALRQKYWLLDGRNQVRRIIHKCTRCLRFRADTVNYKMGDLPRERVTITHPFARTGVDFCGPFFIKEKKYRNRGRIKVYVCVFVCMTMKAIHLEVVEDLTTEGFLAAVRRFVARRGTPEHMFSDNGTNFVGANNYLSELYDLVNSKKHQDRVNQWAIDRNVKWHFILPMAPHFGGLWESTVKIFKHHLKRVVGEALFTLHEFETLVIEIEGILNSRPITTLSSDPNDPMALSPNHLLIGRTPDMLLERDMISSPANRLSRWQHISKVRQDFWSRWSTEYLNELQQRRKWLKDGENLKVGAVVLVKTKTLPCLQWPLARVIQVHPGADGVVRVATIKTAHGEFQRSVKLLCPLPEEDAYQ